MEKVYILNAVKDGTLYDLVGNEIHRFDKDQLATIAKEALYALHRAEHMLGKEAVKVIEQDFLSELKQRLY